METYDALYGRPGAGLQRRLGGLIRRIVDMASWDAFFECCGFQPPLHTLRSLRCCARCLQMQMPCLLVARALSA